MCSPIVMNNSNSIIKTEHSVFSLTKTPSTMSSISSLTKFPFKPTSQSQIPSIPPTISTNFRLKTPKQPPIPTQKPIKSNPNFHLRASIGEYAGPEGVGVAEAEPPKVSESDVLKKRLVESFYGTNRGLSASTETRAEIVELISQLEAVNPTPNPTEALTLLNGKWILAYTSFAGLYPLLSRGTLPLVKLEEISQTIDSENFTVQNSVQFAGPLATTSISANAKFEVRSPKRVQIKFEEGIIGTPQLTDSIEFPENVEFLGQKIDLTPFKGVISSVQESASSVARTISNQPPLKFSISNRNTESWLLTTYLDEELRISRGDGGSVFVLIKEGSPLLKP